MNASETAELAEWMARFYADPLGFVMFAYPWGSDPALQIVPLTPVYRQRFNVDYGPDLWACQFLDELGELVRQRGFDGVHAVDAIRMAVASGHGIGKSAITAWLVNWIMSTRPFAKGIVTANTAEQLAGKTWAEICKWTKKSVTAQWWKISAGKGMMRISHIDHPEAWLVTGLTCREENAEAFAGLHAADSTPFYIFDEASAIPDTIAEVAEGGLTDGEPMFFKFGNPTRNSGDFHRCFHAMRHRWQTRQIDSREVSITNKNQIQQWLDDYGADSDFVKIRVRGLFPSLSAKQFIATADVDAAYGRELRSEQFDFAAKILTCDPAWEGDDLLVIGLRQGLLFRVLRAIPKNDNDIEIANILARHEDEQGADAVFIDAGYGTGIVSAGHTLGRDWQLVWFSAASADPGCLNKRAEMWKQMRDWLKQGGCLPKDPELHAELVAPETVPRLDGKIQLESKHDMKKRRLPSPNKADALALSFAYPVQKKAAGLARHRPRAQAERGHDPFARLL
ncbi:terminase [Methylomonas paludis]|uniref:Terminase n=1 Tax=Methylomonas paludis TaxID=1173101 RepID=A0A975MR44_9GAMM|nr:terminase [Methylomonas paludis]QWF71964.1 terminase [Methylomonas paludis]